MKIELTKDINSDYTFFSIVIMFTFYGSIPLAIYLRYEPLLLFMLVGLLYFCVSANTNTCNYINKLTEFSEVFNNVAEAINNPPSITLKFEAYHEIKKWTGDTPEIERVVTLKGEKVFNCSNFVDESPSIEALYYLN